MHCANNTFISNHSNHLLIHQTIKFVNTIIPEQETVHAMQILNMSKELLCNSSKSQGFLLFKVKYTTRILPYSPFKSGLNMLCRDLPFM